ncbi:uncharacterized protein LOC120161294 isoform X2 [Hibiscus syriacus]|uniref:uncharacterized protein LOC120161294 isoform X2 n=1 Tax=Hibiscus syriacus TaxID=106335 RepID=UPI0019208198|nr:uncharacterized protein LOC120161294 isoform X2 [Hibiscus syriacus]
MDYDGQRGSTTTPSAMLASLLNRRAKLQEELRNIERQVYDMETSYLQDPSQCGHVLKGFEGFLSSSKNTALLKRSRKFQPEDRLFSLSSVTSPAAEEVAAGRDGEPVACRCINKYPFLMFHCLLFLCVWQMGNRTTAAQVGLRVEVTLPVGKESQRREELEKLSDRDTLVNQISTMMMIPMSYFETNFDRMNYFSASPQALMPDFRFVSKQCAPKDVIYRILNITFSR